MDDQTTLFPPDAFAKGSIVFTELSPLSGSALEEHLGARLEKSLSTLAGVAARSRKDCGRGIVVLDLCSFMLDCDLYFHLGGFPGYGTPVKYARASTLTRNLANMDDGLEEVCTLQNLIDEYNDERTFLAMAVIPHPLIFGKELRFGEDRPETADLLCGEDRLRVPAFYTRLEYPAQYPELPPEAYHYARDLWHS